MRSAALAALTLFALAASASARCGAKEGLDVCMTLDESESIEDAGVKQEKAFAVQLYDNFVEDSTRITVFAFSDSPRLITPLNASFAEGKQAIKADERSSGGTEIIDAMTACGDALAPLGDGRQKVRASFEFLGPPTF
jgi:hypothetical protein